METQSDAYEHPRRVGDAGLAVYLGSKLHLRLKLAAAILNIHHTQACMVRRKAILRHTSVTSRHHAGEGMRKRADMGTQVKV